MCMMMLMKKVKKSPRKVASRSRQSKKPLHRLVSYTFLKVSTLLGVFLLVSILFVGKQINSHATTTNQTVLGINVQPTPTLCQTEGGICVAQGRCRADGMSCPTRDTKGNNLGCGPFSGCYKQKGALVAPTCNTNRFCGAGNICAPTKLNGSSTVKCSQPLSIGQCNTGTYVYPNVNQPSKYVHSMRNNSATAACGLNFSSIPTNLIPSGQFVLLQYGNSSNVFHYCNGQTAADCCKSAFKGSSPDFNKVKNYMDYRVIAAGQGYANSAVVSCIR